MPQHQCDTQASPAAIVVIDAGVPTRGSGTGSDSGDVLHRQSPETLGRHKACLQQRKTSFFLDQFPNLD